MTTSIDKPLLTRLFEYVIRPTYSPLKAQSSRQTLIEVTQLFGFNLTVTILLSIPLVFVTRSLGLDNSISDVLKDVSLVWSLVLIVLLGPLFEEVWFRLFLRPSPLNLVAPLCPTLFLVARFALPLAEPVLAKLRPHIPGWLFWNCLLLMCSLICAGVYPFVKKRFNYENADRFYTKNISYLYYFSSITFGYLHIFNYRNIVDHFHMSFLLMIPYAITGIILGYVRITYGFKWAVFLHTFNNAYAFLPLAIVSLLTGGAGLRSTSEPFTSEPFTSQQLLAALVVIVWFFGTLWWIVRLSLRLIQEMRKYRRSLNG